MKRLFRNGMSAEQDWQRFDQDDVDDRRHHMSRKGDLTMLQLGSSTFEVDGVTVFADHADPDQFWYLAIARRLRQAPGRQRCLQHDQVEAGRGRRPASRAAAS